MALSTFRRRPVEDGVSRGRGLQVKRARVAGTCEWLVDDNIFQSWRTSTTIDDNTLWIHGPVGSGKTFIAQYVCDVLQQSAEDPPTVCYMCEATSSPLIMICSILRLLLQNDKLPQPSLQLILSTVTELEFGVQPLPYTAHAAWNLFETAIQAVRSLNLVIDGLDELPDDYLSDINFNIPMKFQQLAEKSEGKLRLFLTSRTTALVRDVYRSYPQIALTPEKTEADMKRFATSEIQKYPFLSTQQELILNIVLAKAEGIFIWTFITIQALSIETFPEALIKRLENLESTLDNVYASLLEKQRTKLSPLERETQDTILTWVVNSMCDLSCREIGSAVDIDDHNQLTEIEDRIIHTCGLLVKIENGLVKPIHRSLRDFVCSSKSDIVDLIPYQGETAHELITTTCLKYLTQTDLKVVSLATLDRNDVKLRFPLLRYATLYWIYHFRLVNKTQDRVLELAIQFFQSDHLFVWADTCLSIFLSESTLHIPPRPSNSARIAYLFQLRSQLTGAVTERPELREGLDETATSSLLSAYTTAYEDAVAAAESESTGSSLKKRIEVIRRTLDLGEVHGWISGHRPDSERTLMSVMGQVQSLNLIESSSPELRSLGLSVYQAQADSLKRGGKYHEARSLLLQLIQLFDQQPQPLSHTDTTNKFFALDSLGWSCKRLDLFAEAEIHLTHALDLATHVYGSTSPAILRAKVTLAEVLSKLDRAAEADLYCDELASALQRFRDSDTDLPPDYVSSLNVLAGVYVLQGKLQDAVDTYETLVDCRRKGFGAENPVTIWAEMQLGLAREKVVVTEEEMDALRLYFERLVANQERILGLHHPDVGTSREAIRRLRGS